MTPGFDSLEVTVIMVRAPLCISGAIRLNFTHSFNCLTYLSPLDHMLASPFYF